MRICLIRHGKTAGNVKRQYIGRKTDEPLCEEGRQELIRFYQAGRYPKAEAVIVSPMKRCIETAELLYSGQKMILCEGLVETDFGSFEGKTYEELKDQPVYRHFLESGGELPFPGGETKEEMAFRVTAAFWKTVKALQKEDRGSAVFLFHGGPIMAVMSSLIPESGFYDWQCPSGDGWEFLLSDSARSAGQVVRLSGKEEKQCSF